LFISNADGSGERALTQPGALDYNPSWSQSGDWIVFTSERGGSVDLYRIHPDGTGLDRLTDDPAYDDQGALSPDGKQTRLRQHPCRKQGDSLGIGCSRAQSQTADFG
jgi:Tol biopolymer transport system component